MAERDGSFDPQEIIASLRKKLEQAQERIAACEKQAKEWKEIAQQTLKAAQVLKAKMETEKVATLKYHQRLSHVSAFQHNPGITLKPTAPKLIALGF